MAFVNAIFILPQTRRDATWPIKHKHHVRGTYIRGRLDVTLLLTSIAATTVASEHIERTVVTMAPKPASTTGGKAPVSGTGSKQPAKTVEGAKGAKKTAKTAAPPAAGEEKKKRRKLRKETYSSYIYKGASLVGRILRLPNRYLQSSSKSILKLVSQTRPWPS